MVSGQETRVSATPGNAQTPSTSQSSSDESTLKRLEQDWLDSYREGDAEKMGNILAEDFIGRWADRSTQTKEQQLKGIRTGEEKHSSNHLDE